MTVEKLPYTQGLIVRSGGPGEGNLYLEGVKIRWYRFGVNCYYGPTVPVHIGPGGALSIASLPISGGSFLCGPVGAWTPTTANYSISTPNPFYVSWF